MLTWRRRREPLYNGELNAYSFTAGVWRWLAMLLISLFVLAMLAMPWVAPWFYWDANSSTQWVPPPPANLNASDYKLLAPKIIHHRWNDDNLPPKWAAVRDRCIAMHPDYTFMLWTEEREREMIKEHFPFFLKTYDGYRYTIQQADVSRYFFLYVHGGLYLDLDVECLQRVDYLLTYEILVPLTWPVGFSNDVLVTPARHPFYKQVTDAAPKWDKMYGTKYPTVMFSTGPMFLTYQAMLYPNRSQIWVLPRSLYGKWTHSAAAYFAHYHASMWHSSDAAAVLFLWHMRYLILLVAGLAGAYVWYKRKRAAALEKVH